MEQQQVNIEANCTNMAETNASSSGKTQTPKRRTPKKKKTAVAFTPREKEVISLCCHGLSNKEIAIHLDISVRTVDTHKINIFQKMEVNNTQKLVQFAIKNKLATL